MEIVESEPPSLVRVRQNFTRPFKMDSTVEFVLRPENSGTHITWAMSGKNGLLNKTMGIFMNMDKMLGKEFDKGLARLKTVAESRPAGDNAAGI